LERKAPPTFQVLVELSDRNVVGIYFDIALTVDSFLHGKKPKPELRKQEIDGSVLVLQKESSELYTDLQTGDLDEDAKEKLKNDLMDKRVNIYAFGINRDRVDRAIKILSINAKVTMNIDDADIVVTTKAHNKPNSNLIRSLHGRNISINVIKSDTMSQITRFLKYVFKLYNDDEDTIKSSLKEVGEVLKYVGNNRKVAEVSPASSYIRRLQKHLCVEQGFRCESIGEEPNRRVRIFPKL
jgi:predicted RNA-binding protein Jag